MVEPTLKISGLSLPLLTIVPEHQLPLYPSGFFPFFPYYFPIYQVPLPGKVSKSLASLMHQKHVRTAGEF